MSQDLIRTPRILPGDPADVWGAPAPTTALAPLGPPAGGAPPVQPLQKLHRVLRGRYLLAVGLGLAGAVVGGVAGWMSQEQMYKAVGSIQIKPVVLMGVGSDQTIPYYDKYMKTQAALLQSTPVLQEALRRDEWRTADGPALDPGAVQGRLKADYVNNSNVIAISYESESPKLASAMIRALLGAYEVRRGDASTADYAKQIEETQNKLISLTNDISRLKTQIRAVGQIYGTMDLATRFNPRSQELAGVDQQLNQVSYDREQAETALKDRAEKQSQITADQLAERDPFLKSLLGTIGQLDFEIAKAQRDYSDNHPYVKRLRAELELTQAQIDKQVEKVRQEDTAVVLDLDGNARVVTPLMVEQYKSREDRMRDRAAALRTELKSVGDDQMRLREYQDDIDKLLAERDATERKLDTRNAEAVASGGIYSVMDRGAYARVSDDNRKKFALLGAAGGGAIPFGLVLLWGLLDSRFRFSDEATGDVLGSPTLLGILPNLPDRLSDPNQASIAAHCVHQIRTMLQLNALNDGPAAFAVTSATSGDGKTSLSLALGLSFAASGSRTLLIDTDLVGAGLSSRLEVHDDAGVVEALTSGDLMGYVRETDVADLAILPVGSAGAHHAGNFSPAAMRKLIAEAKRQFEVILIDTGPLLGSIEATPTAASVDGVILTVARGQSKPMVDKALQHLQHIGARLAGVVFNRAQARDFEQSINGMSMQSTARSIAQAGTNGNGRAHHNGHGETSLGPVASAVASNGGHDGAAN